MPSHSCVLCRGTVLLGFEQATKYGVYDADGTPVALIAEEVSGIGNELQRQLLRTRRSFTSTVLTPDGECAAHAHFCLVHTLLRYWSIACLHPFGSDCATTTLLLPLHMFCGSHAYRC